MYKYFKQLNQNLMRSLIFTSASSYWSLKIVYEGVLSHIFVGSITKHKNKKARKDLFSFKFNAYLVLITSVWIIRLLNRFRYTGEGGRIRWRSVRWVASIRRINTVCVLYASVETALPFWLNCVNYNLVNIACCMAF